MKDDTITPAELDKIEDEFLKAAEKKWNACTKHMRNVPMLIASLRAAWAELAEKKTENNHASN
jgi:hypothetical protein